MPKADGTESAFIQSVWSRIDWLGGALKHVRYLTRRPYYAAIAITILALGIGANTALYSVTMAILWRPLPFRNSERLVEIWETQLDQDLERFKVSPGTFSAWRKRSQSFERLALFRSGPWLLASGVEAEQITGATVSPELFDVVGIRPLLGSSFHSRVPTGEREPEMVIGHGLWQRRFGSDPRIVGRQIALFGGSPYTVVGVMPSGFSFPEGTEAWRPEELRNPVGGNQRRERYRSAIGLLKPGVTLAQARMDLEGVSRQLSEEYPSTNRGWSVGLESLHESLVAEVRPSLVVLALVVFCLLLNAVGNVANLWLAANIFRQRETAIRVAVGAGRHRLLAQGLAESLVILGLGAFAGILLAWWVLRIVVSLRLDGLPRLQEIHLDAGVCSVTVGVCALVLLGLNARSVLRAPNVAHDALSGAASYGATGTRRYSGAKMLIALEVALAIVSVASAALLARSLVQLNRIDVGFSADGLQTAELRLRAPEAVRRPWYLYASVASRLIEIAEGLPGVESAAAISCCLPLSRTPLSTFVWKSDSPGDAGGTRWAVSYHRVTPRYFRTMNIPLLRGRDFDDSDEFTEDQLTQPHAIARTGAAIVNERLARLLFGEPQRAIGQILALDFDLVESREIVGVVGNVLQTDLSHDMVPEVYLPFGESPTSSLALVARVGSRADAIGRAFRERLSAMENEVVIFNIRTMNRIAADALWTEHARAFLVTAVAALATLLAIFGIYGVLAFMAAARQHEIAVRVALGASPRDIAWLVLQENLLPIGLGTVLGLASALALAGFWRAVVFGITVTDPVSYIVASVLPHKSA